MGKLRTRTIPCVLFLLPVLIGCTGSLHEGVAKDRDPSSSAPESVAPAAAAPVPDESEMIRLRAKELLLGKWRREAQGADTIEFHDDGTITFFSAVERIAYPGSYRILDKDQIEIRMKDGSPLAWGYAVTRWELTLTTPTGVGMKYKRLRGK